MLAVIGGLQFLDRIPSLLVLCWMRAALELQGGEFFVIYLSLSNMTACCYMYSFYPYLFFGGV